MKPNLLRVLFLLVVFLIALFVITKVDLNKITASLAHLQSYQILILVALYFAMNGVLIVKNYYFLRVLGYCPKFKNIILIYFSATLAQQAVPGKLGYPAAAYLYKKFENVRLTDSTIFLATDFFMSILVLGSVAFLGSIVYFRGRTLLLVVGLTTVIGSILAILLFLKVYLKRTKKNKLFNLVKSIQEGLKKFSVAKLIVVCLFYFADIILSGLFLHVLALALGGSVSLPKIIVADTSSFIFGALSMLPMGLGAQDASVLFYFKSFGVPLEVVAAIITVQRILIVGLNFSLGFLSAAALGLSNFQLLRYDRHTKNES